MLILSKVLEFRTIVSSLSKRKDANSQQNRNNFFFGSKFIKKERC